MNKVKTFEREIAGRKVIVEIGKLAGQAHGSCTVRYGDTVVLATAVIAPEEREGVDYFPLMVDYEERLYAAGKIKGSRFIKREGRATDEAVLTARLIDRSIRPLFKDTVRKDVQVVVTVLSVDGENDADVPAMLAASIAVAISPIPWAGPLSGVRVGRTNGAWIINPTYAERLLGDLDLFVAGTADEVVMIEAGGKQVTEKDFFDAVATAQKQNADIMTFIKKIVSEAGTPKHPEPALDKEDKAVAELVDRKVKGFLTGKDLLKVFSPDKEKTRANTSALKEELDVLLKADDKDGE